MEIKRIFISHCYQDRLIADRLIDKLIVPICLLDKQKDIFYTSKRITGIKPSQNWKEKIKSTIKTCDIFIAIITPNYRKSEMCISEIGAAWVLDKKIYPLIVPPITFDNFNITISELQAESLLKSDNVESLINSLKNDVKRIYNTTTFKDENQKIIIQQFTKSLRQYLRKNPFGKSDKKVLNIKEEENDQDDIDNGIEEETNEMKIIREQSKIEWPDDFSMQLYFINEQKAAVKELQRIISTTPNPQLTDIIYKKAQREWPRDFNMQLYTLREQIEAYKKLK